MKKSTSRTVAATLAILVGLASLPSSTPSPTPIPAKMVKVPTIFNPQHAALLDKLESQGFKVGESVSVAGERASSFWNKLLPSPSAQEAYMSDGSSYLTITALDDGDPATGEYFSWVSSPYGVGWGVTQFMYEHPEWGAWYWDVGAYETDASFGQKLYNALAPTAMCANCGYAFDIWDFLAIGFAGGVGNLITSIPGCALAGGAIGACLGGQFIWGAAAGLWGYNAVYAANMAYCRLTQG